MHCFLRAESRAFPLRDRLRRVWRRGISAAIGARRQVLGAPAQEQPGGQEEQGRQAHQGEPAQGQGPLPGERQPGWLVNIPTFERSYIYEIYS